MDCRLEFTQNSESDEAQYSPNLAIAHNNRGVARLATGDPEGAIADYDRALSLDSAYAMAYANRGMAHLAQIPDVEVTVYLGKLHKLPRFEAFLPHAPEKWLERALASVQPVLECGMSIGSR